MKITLGYFLDGHAFPGPLENSLAVDGYLTLGPLGFLSMLETWLGLPSDTVPGGKRIAQSLKAAKECCKSNPKPFYAESLANSPWATAQRLLSIRNELLLSGWNGSQPKTNGKRISDLAKFNQKLVASRDLPARLDAVLTSLSQWKLPHELKITLLESEEYWPQCWKRLFSTLKRIKVSFENWDQPVFNDGNNKPSTLRKVQDFFAKKNIVTTPVNDNSIIILASNTVDEAAETVSQILPLSFNGKTVLLRTDPSLLFENGLLRFHKPTTGYAPESRWRSILQLLPICLRMRWAPRSIQSLIDFLLLPAAPVPSFIRNIMLNAIQEFPGIGNEKWNVQATNAQTILYKKYGKEYKEKWNEYLQWLVPEEVSEEKGMPLNVIQSVCSNLSSWALKCAKTEQDNGLYKVLAAQAIDFADMAQEAGEETFSRPTLEAMLDHECALGADHIFSQEEAAPWAIIDHPGQLHGQVDTLIWWLFRDKKVNATHFWTENERSWLIENNFMPTTPFDERQLEYLSWTRAFSLIRKQCILVIPNREYGEEILPHPFLDYIASAFSKKTKHIYSLFSQSSSTLLKYFNVHTASVTNKEISVEPDGALRIPKQSIPNIISYTHADYSIKCPFHGFLSLFLKPHGPSASSVPNILQVLGDFSHYIIQYLIEHNNKCSLKKNNYISEIIKQLLPSHAAMLLESQYTITRQYFILSMERIFEQLLSIFSDKNLKDNKSECDMKRKLPFCDSVLQGKADTLLTYNNKTVILDLKWSSARKKYVEMLEEGTAYQLAAYAWMQNDTSKTIEAAYWLLPINEFLGSQESGASDNGIFTFNLNEIWTTMQNQLEKIFKEWENGELAIAERDEKGKIPKFSNCNYCELSFVCGRGYAKD